MKELRITLLGIGLVFLFSFAFGANLLTNPDFEEWADGQAVGWTTTVSPQNATYIQDSEAHLGSSSAKVSATAAYGGIRQEHIAYTATESEPLTLTCWIKDVTDTDDPATEYVRLLLTEWYQGGPVFDVDATNQVADTLATEWTQYTLVADSTPPIDELEIQFGLYQTDAIEYYIDDVVLTAGADSAVSDWSLY